MGVHALVSMVIILSCMQQYDGLEADDLHNAIREVYNRNATFENNVHAITSLFCPESVYCECQNQNRDRCRAIQQSIHEKYSNNSNDQLVAYANELEGCCAPCFCDESCYEKGNCCHDMPVRSPTNEDTHSSSKCIPATIEAHKKSKDYGIFTMANAYFMVTACPVYYSKEDIDSKCHSPRIEYFDEVIPVSSKITGTIYQNIYCAICHNENETVTWEVLVKYDRKLSLINPNFPLSFNDFLNDRFAAIFFKPNDDFAIENNNICIMKEMTRTGVCKRKESMDRIDLDYFDFLRISCFEEAHDNVFSSFYLRNSVFKNVFCYLCESMTKIYPILTPRCDDSFGFKSIAGFLILLKGNEMKIETDLNSHKTVNETCECYGWQDTTLEECRPFLCPTGTVLIGCDCKDLLGYISGVELDIRFEIKPRQLDVPRNSNSSLLTNKYANANLAKDILRKFPSVLKSRSSQSIYMNVMAMFYIQNNSIPGYYILTYITAKANSDTRTLVKELIDGFMRETFFVVNKKEYSIRLGTIFGLNIYPSITFISPSVYDIIVPLYIRQVMMKWTPPELFSKLIICKQIVLSSNETYWLKNYTSQNNEFNREVGYIFSESGSRICFDDFLQLFHPALSSSKCNCLMSGTNMYILIYMIYELLL